MIDTLTAAGLCAEIGNFTRFRHPAQVTSYLGVVPSEESSGERLDHPINRWIEAEQHDCYRFPVTSAVTRNVRLVAGRKRCYRSRIPVPSVGGAGSDHGDDVRVRAITNEEGNRLLRIVRRSSGSVVTWRRAQMILLSTQGIDAARIAEVTFTSPDRVRDV